MATCSRATTRGAQCLRARNRAQCRTAPSAFFPPLLFFPLLALLPNSPALLLPLLFIVFFPLLSTLPLLITFDRRRPLRLLRSLSPPQLWPSLLILTATGIFPHPSVFLPPAPLPLSSSDLRPLPPQLHRPCSATASSITTIVDLHLNLPTSLALLPPLFVAVIISGIVRHHGHRLNHRALLRCSSIFFLPFPSSIVPPSTVLPYPFSASPFWPPNATDRPHLTSTPSPFLFTSPPSPAFSSLFFVPAATVTPPPSPPSSSSASVTDHPSLLPLRHSLSVVVLPTIFAPFPCSLSALSSFRSPNATDSTPISPLLPHCSLSTAIADHQRLLSSSITVVLRRCRPLLRR